MTVNRYTKLIKTLKETPTNSMGGVYSLNPAGYRLRKPDKPKKFYPTIDGTFPDGIPGNTGDPFYLRPEGFWDGGNDWESYQVSDGSQEYLLDDPTGKSTDGMIAEDGTVKSALPPNSRHFILGPLVDGYVENHGSDNYTNIGYLQKDTRQFVLLARIQGQFTADLHQEGARVWDGSSDQLTIYNSNFTLAMAEWFRDNITGGSFTRNVPYFYSGGVPQQSISGGPNCPNCPPNMFGGIGPGTNGRFGSGGPGPTLGDGPNPNPEPKSGNDQDAGGPFLDLLGGPLGLLGDLLGGPLGAINDGLNALLGLPELTKQASSLINGLSDGLATLVDVKGTVDKAEAEGNITPIGSDPQFPDRPGIADGALGSPSNPLPRTLSDTSNEVLSKNINRNMTGPELRQQVQNNINDNFNFGTKGTINNISSASPDPFFNDNGDLVINDTYAFTPGGDIKYKPLYPLQDLPFVPDVTVGDFAKQTSGGDENLEKAVLEFFDKGIGNFLPGLMPKSDGPVPRMQIIVPAKNIKESYRPKFLNNRERQPITEGISNQKRILREIRKPVEIKETPTKYKINFPKQDTSSSQTDELVGRANARGQQWRSDNKRWSGYETTEKDNIIQDRVGHGKQAFDYMIEHGTKRSEWRTKEVQEELNKIAHEKAMLKENPDFKSPFGKVEVSTTEKNIKNFEKVNRIKQVVVDKKMFSNKEIKPEYPSDPVPQPGEVHPKLQSGENAAAKYKKLDPISAKSMPDTAYPQINDLRDKARNKSK